MSSRRRILGAIAAVLLASAAGVAHEPPPRPSVRELVRLQGHRRADGDAPAGRLELTVLGSTHPFAATAHEAFRLAPEAAAEKLATRYALQGPRPLLVRFAAARADQLVTILAEHRPGGADLFVLALDFCPPQ